MITYQTTYKVTEKIISMKITAINNNLFLKSWNKNHSPPRLEAALSTGAPKKEFFIEIILISYVFFFYFFIKIIYFLKLEIKIIFFLSGPSLKFFCDHRHLSAAIVSVTAKRTN